MKRMIMIFAMALLGFALGALLGRQARGGEHEHDYDKTVYVTSPCCLYDEEYDCEEQDEKRVCKTHCAAWGKKMKQYERCACGARRFVSATECSSNL